MCQCISSVCIFIFSMSQSPPDMQEAVSSVMSVFPLHEDSLPLPPKSLGSRPCQEQAPSVSSCSEGVTSSGVVGPDDGAASELGEV